MFSIPRRQGARRRHKPVFDRLEERLTLSLGSEFLAVPVKGVQLASAASMTKGSSVVVWSETVSATDSNIRARLFNASGFPTTGVIGINTTPSTVDTAPSVAMNSNGGFAVAWTRTYPSGFSRVFMAQFNAAGQNIHGANAAIAVSSTNRGALPALAPSVAVDAAGNAVVAYEVNASQYAFITQYDVAAKMYTAQGNYLKTIVVAADPSLNEFSPSVARSQSGRFTVAYVTQAVLYTGNPTLKIQNYNPNGVAYGSTVTVADGSAALRLPNLSLYNDSFGVLTYQKQTGTGSNDIEARYFNTYGTVTSEFTVRASSAQETAPKSVMLRPYVFVTAYTVNTTSVGVTEVHGTFPTSYVPFSNRTYPVVARRSTFYYTLIERNSGGYLNGRFGKA